MLPALLFLLSLNHLQPTIFSSILETSKYDLNNALDNSNEENGLQLPSSFANDDDELLRATTTSSASLPLDASDAESARRHVPLIKSDHDRTEIAFKEAIAAISIDYDNNILKLAFEKPKWLRQKQLAKFAAEEDRRRKSLENNFMRFGKREKEELPAASGMEYDLQDALAMQRFQRSQGARDARGDNFMRFGRNPKDFMRFGRNPKDFMRFGRAAAAADFMRFGRSANNDFLRFGKSDFMRFGRAAALAGDNYMRFGRNPSQDFMRFGRNPQHDFMRFGRAQKTQRSADKNQMSFGRTAADFIRFGRNPPLVTDGPNNFMRFGKSEEKVNQTATPLLQKSEIREAAKILHKSEEGGDENNPVDKAINVLFKKHKAAANAERLREADMYESQNGESLDDNLLMDYGFNANSAGI